MKQPISYTANEGGYWLPWDNEVAEVLVTKELLEAELQFVTVDLWGKRICLGNIKVHSLLFGPISDPESPRWDCINGWTKHF